jgi:transcriptional regulator with XRE-family HTH domain
MFTSITSNSLTGKDLIADLWSEPYTLDVSRTFRERVGDALLLRREQMKKWSRRQAALRMNADAGTIKAIEQGGNAGWEFFERYAEVLDTTLEDVLRDAIQAGDRVPAPGNSPEADLVAQIYRSLRDVNSRRLLLEMAEKFRDAENPLPQAHAPSAAAGDGTEVSDDAESTGTRRARGA